MIGGAIYEVADPIHPRLLCHVQNTQARLFTGDTFTYPRPAGAATEIVLHSMGSGDETVIATFPVAMQLSWGGYLQYVADGSEAATETETTDSSGNAALHVWLASQRGAGELYAFPLPLTDCICRFGLTPPTLAFSPDGQYLVSGWPVGKGAALAALEVHSVVDGTLVKTFDSAYASAAWDATGHRLYVSGQSASASWTPESGQQALPGSAAWPYEPSLAPDGSAVAYTAYRDASVPTSLRVYVYGIGGRQTRMLVDRLRSEVVFVKDGWVWYREEAACDPAQPSCGPWGTAPTQRVFAMNLASGVETPVAFAAGQSPVALRSGWGAGTYWPNS